MTTASVARPRVCPQLLLSLAALGVAAVGCGNSTPAPATGTPDASGLQNLFDVAISGIGADWRAKFNDGDALFEVQLRDADGLGPLYTWGPSITSARR
jgi:hypothetical protein